MLYQHADRMYGEANEINKQRMVIARPDMR